MSGRVSVLCRTLNRVSGTPLLSIPPTKITNLTSQKQRAVWLKLPSTLSRLKTVTMKNASPSYSRPHRISCPFYTLSYTVLSIICVTGIYKTWGIKDKRAYYILCVYCPLYCELYCIIILCIILCVYCLLYCVLYCIIILCIVFVRICICMTWH